jgi:DNA-binding NarL/FixJ family response regulator
MTASSATQGVVPIRIVVVDDQSAVREAMAMSLDLFDDIDVVGTAANGALALEVCAAQRPDVVLMDLRMPVMDGVEATRALTSPPTADEAGADDPGGPGGLGGPAAPAVVILTTFADEESILAALGAGAAGYLTKDASRADIARAVHSAAAGQAVLDRTVQQRLMASVAARAGGAGRAPSSGAGASGAGASGGGPSVGGRSRLADLTSREREVLTLIGQGLSNRAIATQLFVSEATVKTHINNLFTKTGSRDRSDAVRLAFTEGLV